MSVRYRHHGRKIVGVYEAGTTTQDAAPRRATIDDVKKTLADLSERIDRWNERRKQSDARNPALHVVNFAEHVKRVRGINEANAKFWRARG